MEITKSIRVYVENNVETLSRHSEKLAQMYKKCFIHTFETVSSKKGKDGSCYLGSGDITAMWQRDSSTQVWNYVRFAKDPEIGEFIRGVLKRQFKNIQIDPYANAFNETDSDLGHVDDLPRKSPWVWERKYEIDSLAYPIRLIYGYWKETGDDDFVRHEFPETLRIIIDIWKIEQHHFEKSEYRFFRNTDRYNDTIHNNGMGEPVGYTGMTWQGFRPSDDAGTYGYSIPSNLFAYIVLGYADEMLTKLNIESDMLEELRLLRIQIHEGVRKYGIVKHEKYGEMFAYEIDGLGNYALMDDANIPNLISLPYIGYDVTGMEQIYKNTRQFILSSDNPYYYIGKFAKGLGSPHEYTGYIWHMGLSIQGLTAETKEEMREVLDMLISTDADTGYMHECFDADDPHKFKRPFFPWSDSLFCEFVEKCIKENLFDDGEI